MGGRLVTPFYVTEDTPYRPEVIVWVELPEGLIVSFTVIDPKGAPVSFGDTLLEAMESPEEGPPRQPTIIRVADAQLAMEVRRVLPEVEIVQAPTPELGEILEMMNEFPAGEDGDAEPPSYLEAGRISAERIEGLFGAAQLLYRIAPWKTVGDSQVLRLDIPQLGVEGACVSIIGALGESIGLIIFPSLMALDSFLEATAEPKSSSRPIDLGTTTLSLNFERGADLPDSMRREVVEHEWPVAGPDAYPIVQHRDRDGVSRPLSEQEIQVVSSCALSLTSFFIKHGDLFARDEIDTPVCESYFDDDDLEVRFTVPYEAGPLFDVNGPREIAPAPSSRPAPSGRGRTKASGKVGRNEPCPCGSGKKYKRCCLNKVQSAENTDAAPAVETDTAPAAIHKVDERLVEQMMRYARRRFGFEWFHRARADFDDPEMSVNLVVCWAVYHLGVEGKPVVDWFLEDRKSQLSNTERTWLTAQQAAWLSVWEVLDVEPGSSITLKDLLTDEERTVREISASRTAAHRDAILGRIVDHEGLSVLAGIHHRPLPPAEAADVVQRIRGRLRRKRAIPVDRLQNEKIGRYMIARWEEAVEALDIRLEIPPQLQNTDGDDLLLTTDHFEFDPGKRDELDKCLASLDGVDHPERDDPDPAYVFLRPRGRMGQSRESTVIGRAVVFRGKLRLETNSIARADALRERIEEATGSLIRHRAREHSDPIAGMKERGRRPRAPEKSDDIPQEVADRVIQEAKTRHYTDWPDHPLPALGGKTPRTAVRTKAGREQVSLLLKSCENAEARSPEGQRFDFTPLRKELGLDS